MTLELNRATFRRLVQLQFATLILSVVAIAIELTSARWSAFSEEFDVVSARHFGAMEWSDAKSIEVAIAVTALALWMVASLFGLLWFKRWARTGVWLSVLIVLMVLAAAEGYRPSYTSPLFDALSLIDGAFLGTTIMMAYARGLGAEWFAAVPTEKD